MRPVGLEQLEHPFVRTARLARERPRHDVRNVVVADRYGVRVAERGPGHLGHRPRSDPVHRRQPLLGGVERERGGLVDPRRPGAHLTQHVGAAALDAERVERVVGERGDPFGIRRQRQAERARGGFGERGHEAAVRTASLVAGDLLLEDHGEQPFGDQAGPRDPQAADGGATGPAPTPSPARSPSRRPRRRTTRWPGRASRRRPAPTPRRRSRPRSRRTGPTRVLRASARRVRRTRRSVRIVGSPRPRCIGPSVCWMSIGRCVRTSLVATPVRLGGEAADRSLARAQRSLRPEPCRRRGLVVAGVRVSRVEAIALDDRDVASWHRS